MNWIESVRHDIAELPSSDSALKKFGLTVGGVMIALALVSLWRMWWSDSVIIGLLIVGTGLFAAGVIAPRSLRKIYRVWMSFAVIMGSIVSRIILSFIYFFILTPVALIARLTGKEFLPGLLKKTTGSLWIQRDRTKQIKYERMS